jgi:predicted acetyltransferase
MQIDVTPANIDEKPILQRLMELYLYDFTEFEDIPMDSSGLFGDPWLDFYWSEKGRFPFLIRADGKLAGFVLVNQHTHLADSEWTIAEFFILRQYRRQGVGKAAAFSTFARFGGKWEVHQLERNIPAQHFWRKVITEYTGGLYTEIHIQDEGKRGPLQLFDHSRKDGVPPAR